MNDDDHSLDETQLLTHGHHEIEDNINLLANRRSGGPVQFLRATSRDDDLEYSMGDLPNLATFDAESGLTEASANEDCSSGISSAVSGGGDGKHLADNLRRCGPLEPIKVGAKGDGKAIGQLAKQYSLTKIEKPSANVPQIELNWQNLTYTVSKTVYNFKSIRNFRQNDELHLLKNVSGSLVSGHLTGIIGPSGAGKTTLLECLAGRRSLGISHGSIRVFGPCGVKLAYNAQEDQQLDMLTVRESLLFASKLKNYNLKDYKTLISDDLDGVVNNNGATYQNGAVRLAMPRVSHESIVDNVLEQLRLTPCADVRVANCSGGQKKRLNIGVELISNPNILVLDEPTSGLDSSSSLQCISLMQRLAHNPHHPMAVVASIHQPSAKLLAFFDHLYIMATGGRCIYNGPVDQLLPYLAQFGLHCPNYHNPADFVTEVAIGMHGEEVIDSLKEFNQEINVLDQEASGGNGQRGIRVDKLLNQSCSQSRPAGSYATWLLFKRSNLTSIRDPQVSWLRFGATAVLVGLICILYWDSDIGKADGCYALPEMASFDHTSRNKEQIAITDNVSFVFFSLLFAVLNGKMPMVLVFPMEMGVFMKEKADGLYSTFSYYLAKSFSDLPFQIVFPITYSFASYYITYQIAEYWRFLYYMGVMFAISAISQSFGLMIGALYVADVNSAVFAGAIITLPILLFAGIFVRIGSLPTFLQYVSFSSYFRLCFEAVLVSIYGYGRCPVHPPNITELMIADKLGDHFYPVYDCFDQVGLLKNITDGLEAYNQRAVDQNGSMVLDSFSLDDDSLRQCWIAIAIYIVILRIAGFLLLHWKAKQKK